MIKAILKPFNFIFKTIKFVVMLPINLVKFVLSKVWAVVKYVLNPVWKVVKGLYKVMVGVFNEGTQVITWIITSIWNAIKWVFEKVIKVIKFIWAWLVEAFVETLNQLWTLLGMFAAWLVLEGSAKTIVGYAIITVLIVWLITIRIREGEE